LGKTAIETEPDLERGVQQQQGPIGRRACVPAGAPSRSANSRPFISFDAAGRLSLETMARTQRATALPGNDLPVLADMIVKGLAGSHVTKAQCNARRLDVNQSHIEPVTLTCSRAMLTRMWGSNRRDDATLAVANWSSVWKAVADQRSRRPAG
jgi:hypothetical protein